MENMLKKLENKISFFDIDGTLAEFRYNDKLCGNIGNKKASQNLNELLFGDLFLKARPLKLMQNIISNLNPENVYILGVVLTNNEIKNKEAWLEKHYPSIKKENILFIASSEFKPYVIEEYVKHLNLDKNDAVFIDDNVSALQLAESIGIKSYHISSFYE